ncbi:MAG: hypothetical protein Q7R94_00410 [bacterium]|nr:hypothetical protein [bacterium]
MMGAHKGGDVLKILITLVDILVVTVCSAGTGFVIFILSHNVTFGLLAAIVVAVICSVVIVPSQKRSS